jgi:hypothetical protein
VPMQLVLPRVVHLRQFRAQAHHGDASVETSMTP